MWNVALKAMYDLDGDTSISASTSYLHPVRTRAEGELEDGKATFQKGRG